MFLAPSSIYFTNCTGKLSIQDITKEKDLIDVSRKIVQSGDYPKLQVVEKDGNYFTLNNTQLQLCRRLEQDGMCRKVKVERISMTQVPEGIRKMMTVPTLQNSTEIATSNEDTSRTTSRGYHKVQTKDSDTDKKNEHTEESEEEESDDSCFLDTDSEYEWSDDGGLSSGEDSTEIVEEKESLL
ncbi:hypothetical protein ScPMuIL_004606 [Solemya velum]